MDAKPLSYRQEQFCLEYPKDSDPVQAAIRAGYSDRYSRTQGPKLLENELIRARIGEFEAAKRSVGGRPPKFDEPEEMQDAIDEYFETLSVSGEAFPIPPTVSGLAYHLGMSTEALRNYESKDRFLATVKRAKQRIEMYLERRLYGNSPTGAIFNLKNNFKWKDVYENNNRNADMTEEEIDAAIDSRLAAIEDATS